MMQSLNSCTKAHNRAQLVNWLPRDKVATYMTWDSLNKANQGGVTIFGAQLVEAGGSYGYRTCFLATFCILLVRICIYLAFTLRKGTVYRSAKHRDQALVFEPPLVGVEAGEEPAGLFSPFECESQRLAAQMGQPMVICADEDYPQDTRLDILRFSSDMNPDM